MYIHLTYLTGSPTVHLNTLTVRALDWHTYGFESRLSQTCSYICLYENEVKLKILVFLIPLYTEVPN